MQYSVKYVLSGRVGIPRGLWGRIACVCSVCVCGVRGGELGGGMGGRGREMGRWEG